MMIELKTVNLSDDELNSLFETEVSILSDFAVAFVTFSDRSGEIDASSAGSGTLVSIDGLNGIPTAAHVIEQIEKRQRIGLTFELPGAQVHRVQFDVADAHSVSFPLVAAPDHGPDLGVLVPPHSIIEQLRSRKSFFNLSKRQQKQLEAPNSIHLGMWALSGVAAEHVTDAEPEKGYKRVKKFSGLHLVGKVKEERTEGNFDYLFVEALYNDQYQGPDDCAGFSGGGLWQLELLKDSTGLRVQSRTLCGVAFFQSEKAKNAAGETTREIKCHGRKSIYRQLIGKVRKEMPGLVQVSRSND